MAHSTFLQTAHDQSVGLAQIVAARAPDCLSAVLGSCVGIAMHHPRLQMGMLAHVVLPDSQEREAPPGKFADTAVPYMLQCLQRQGAGRAGLTAKIVGGASMFGVAGPRQIGAQNIHAVLASLKEAGVRVTAQDVGGSAGRRVRLCCETGELTVEIAGQTPYAI